MCLERQRVCAQKVRVFERVRTQKSSLIRAHLFTENRTAFYGTSFDQSAEVENVIGQPNEGNTKYENK